MQEYTWPRRTCFKGEPGDNAAMPSPARPLPRRRILAYLVDSLVIFAWIAGLTVFGMTWGAGLFDQIDPASTKLFGHLLSFATLTLPVALYFSLTEASALQASPGKRLLGLAVTNTAGEAPGLVRALIRNGCKFLPWEIAHTAIWHAPGQPFIDPPPSTFMALHIGALVLAGLYFAGLFMGSGRTIYEHISATRVVARR